MGKLNIINVGIWKDICQSLETHHRLYEQVHVSATYSEELIYNALRKNKIHCSWVCGSHTPGVDITIYPNARNRLNPIGVSCKGGTENKTHLEFSGSRTTKQKTLSDKLDYITNGDIILSLVCDRAAKGLFYYSLHTIDASLLDYKSLIWTKEPKKFHGRGSFEAKITHSMSAQVWTSIPKKFIHQTFSYVVDLNQYKAA